MFLHCVTILAVAVAVRGYSAGAPSGACEAMFPAGHNTKAQDSSTTPYKVYVDKHTYTPGSKIKVTLSGKENIKGFFLQGRDAKNTSVIIGSFATNEPDTKKLSCADADDAVTHSKKLSVTKLTFEWTAPANKSGEVKFYATLVKHKETFWVKQPSEIETGSAHSPSVSLVLTSFAILFAKAI